MKQETAEAVAFISQRVKEQWPYCTKDKRLSIIDVGLLGSAILFNDCKTESQQLIVTVDDVRSEAIILNVDGMLGVYYINPEDDREPIRIELMPTKIVQVTKVYEIEVPCFDNTPDGIVIQLSNDYHAVVKDIKREVQENDI